MPDIIDIAQSFEVFAKYANYEMKILLTVGRITVMIDSQKIDIDDIEILERLGWVFSVDLNEEKEYYLLEVDKLTPKMKPTCMACNGRGHTTNDCPYT